LGIEIITAVNMPKQLADEYGVTLGLDYDDVETAVSAISDYTKTYPLMDRL